MTSIHHKYMREALLEVSQFTTFSVHKFGIGIDANTFLQSFFLGRGGACNQRSPSGVCVRSQ